MKAGFFLFFLIGMPIFSNFWANDKGFIWLLILMVATIISTQFSIGMAWAEIFIIRFSFFVFTLIAFASSAFSIRSKVFGYAVAFLLLAFSIFMVDSTNPTLIVLHTTLMTAYMIFIMALVVKQIFEGEKMTVYKIGGGIAAYILIGHIWTSLYMTTYLVYPTAFQTGNQPIPLEQALRQLSYFSFVTLTTIGFGDITAVAPFARALVILEGLLGQLFPAIFIAKLVSLQLEHSKKR